MSRPIRVGIEFHPSILGGTENFLRRLFRHLDPAVTPVVIGAAAGAWESFLAGVETHVVPYLADADTPADVAGALRALRLDVVQSSSFSPVLALAAAQNGLPHIWRLGGDVGYLGRTARERSHLLAIVHMTSCRIVCPSHFLMAQFPDVEPERCQVIHNGIDLDEVPPCPQPASDAAPRVAVLAHLVPLKRHEIFIHSMRRVVDECPTARFHIFGRAFPGPEMHAYAASLAALVHRLNLDEVVRIEALGEDRFARLSSIDVFAFPAVQEGASNAILEIMALGRPIVASRSGSNPELIADGESGVLVPPDDVAALADGIIRVLRSPAQRAALGAAARVRVERCFDIRDSARRYERVYRDVLGLGATG